MQRVLIAAGALAAAAATGYWLGAHQGAEPSRPPPAAAPSNAPPPLEVYAPPPKLSAAEVATHRENAYREMTTMDDVLELPNDFTQTEALYALAGRANERDLDRLIGEATRIADRFDRRAALQILYSRYAELDPHAALAHLAALNLDIDTQVIGTLFQSWAKEDVNAAIAAANAMDNLSRRRAAGNAILQTFAQTDPGRLDEVAARLQGNFDTDHFHAQAIALSANHAPRLALEQALALPTQGARHRAVYQVARVWARNDPGGAFAHGLTIADLRQRSAFLESVVGHWVGDDPRSALDAVRSLPSAGDRDRLLHNAIYHLAGLDPRQAFEVAASLEGRASDQALQQVVDRWMQSDPEAALAAADTIADPAHKRQVLAAAARQYAERDPQAAVLWASQLPEQTRSLVYTRMLNQLARSDPQQALEIALNDDSGQRQRLIGSVIRSTSQQRPELAASFVARLPAGELRRQAASQIASNWAAHDPDAALAWVETLDDGDYLHATGALGFQLAQRDPDRAVAYLERLRPAARESWVGSVASALAGRDVDRAVQFARRFAGDPLYEQAMASAIGQIGYANPGEALRLADTLGEHMREQMRAQIASQWASNDPAAAARWADSQRDLGSDLNVLEMIAGQWSNHDPAAAERWALSKPAGEARDRIFAGVLNNHDLPEDDKVRLINGMQTDALRERAATGAYMALLRHRGDSSAAARLLERLTLSPAQRDQIARFAGAIGK